MLPDKMSGARASDTRSTTPRCRSETQAGGGCAFRAQPADALGVPSVGDGIWRQVYTLWAQLSSANQQKKSLQLAMVLHCFLVLRAVSDCLSGHLLQLLSSQVHDTCSTGLSLTPRR